MVILGLWTTELSVLITSHQGYMLTTQLIAEDVDLEPQAKSVLAIFLPSKFTPLPILAILYLLEASH